MAVLGASVARALFPLQSPLGESVRLGGDWYRVVGTLQERASPRTRAAAIRARDLNRAVIVPLPALDRGGDRQPEGVDEIVFRLASAEDVVAAAGVAQALVRRATGTAPEVVVPREILRQRERTQRVFNVVTGAVAAISLLVGGIGIMNIMLASVLERAGSAAPRARSAPPRRRAVPGRARCSPSPAAFSAARSARRGRADQTFAGWLTRHPLARWPGCAGVGSASASIPPGTRPASTAEARYGGRVRSRYSRSQHQRSPRRPVM